MLKNNGYESDSSEDTADCSDSPRSSVNPSPILIQNPNYIGFELDDSGLLYAFSMMVQEFLSFSLHTRFFIWVRRLAKSFLIHTSRVALQLKHSS